MPESPNPPPSQLPLAARLAIDDVCDAFEADLRAGLAPRVEEFLGNRPEPERAYLLAELAKIEQEYRARGEARTTVPYQPHGRDRDAGLPSVPGYEILSVLGRGGMGVVYRARQLEPSRPVALKMMRAGEFATADERQRFRFEAQTVAALDHPGIVPIYGVGEVGGEPFLCLKYIEKGSLARRMKERSYSPKEAAALVAEVAAAVQHAHDRGVLHRDLKPGNILLDADEKPHVADFGLARRLAAEHSLSPTGAILGTLDYMAP